ncbi:hypothetical protein H0H81_009316, partial [Sphagnurus paluster]
MSSTLAEQLKVKKIELATPLPVQLAVQGSRSHVNFGATVDFEYQRIFGKRYFDVMNLSGYDLILGTPWVYQHKVVFGLNPPRVIIGMDIPEPMEGVGVAQLSSCSMDMYEENLERIREELCQYAQPLCRSALETPLPLLRAINHEIDLINPDKVYPWHPSHCPEALRPLWLEKRVAYIATGRWEVTSGGNTVPMFMMKKP